MFIVVPVPVPVLVPVLVLALGLGLDLDLDLVPGHGGFCGCASFGWRAFGSGACCFCDVWIGDLLVVPVLVPVLVLVPVPVLVPVWRNGICLCARRASSYLLVVLVLYPRWRSCYILTQQKSF